MEHNASTAYSVDYNNTQTTLSNFYDSDDDDNNDLKS